MQQRIGNKEGVAACNGASGTQRSNMNGSTTTLTEYTDTDLSDVGAMRARLAAIDGAYYTSARLNTMTFNDMVYAIRLNDNPSNIKQ